MVSRGVATALLVVSGIVLVSACAASDPPQGNSEAGPTAETRAPGKPVLGVATPDSGDPPECAEPVVHREANVPSAELTVSGVAGDVFSYEVVKDDGSTVAGRSEFTPGQRQAVFTTGVPNAEIEMTRISAHGRTGTPGTCVISTIE